MTVMHYEIKDIVVKFANSGWELISIPSIQWLEALEKNQITDQIIADLISAIEAADIECGSCGCEYDELYKQFLKFYVSLKY
jgi:hypothetical protein